MTAPIGAKCLEGWQTWPFRGNSTSSIGPGLVGRFAPMNEPARAGGSARLGRRVFGEVMRGSA